MRTKQHCTIADVPVPPSANQMYARGAQRVVKTTSYRAWTKSAAVYCRSKANIEQLVTAIRVEIRANIGFNRDLDNLLKPTLDMLQWSGIIKNDRECCSLHIERADYIVIPEAAGDETLVYISPGTMYIAMSGEPDESID